MALYYEERNQNNIAKLADHTKAAALKFYDYCVQNNINILIYETIRTQEKQREYVNSGASKTMRSYHLVGQALDFVPVNGKGETLWSGYGAQDIQKAISYAKSIGFEWGGDWRSFVDKPHLQFNHKGYGTDSFSGSAPVQTSQATNDKVVNSTGDSKIASIQSTLNSRYSAAIKSDGYYGPKTKSSLIIGLQSELNKQFNKGLSVDGIWGLRTKNACVTVRTGAKGNISWIVQAILYCRGYNPNGIDGIFGRGTADAVLRFQKDHGLAQDAIVGRNTFEKLFA